MLAPGSEFVDVAVGSSVLANAGVWYRLQDRFRIGADYDASIGTSNAPGVRNTLGTGHLFAQVTNDSGLGLTVGAGRGLTPPSTSLGLASGPHKLPIPRTVSRRAPNDREGMNVHAVRAVRVRRRSGTARHSLNARVNAGKRKFPQTVTYTRLRNVQPAAAPPPRGSLISCLRLLYGGLGEPRTRRARVLGSPRPSGRHRAGYSHCSCRLARPGALTYRRDITRVS